MTYLGLDIGTTATKAILVDDRQSVLAAATVASRIDQPAPGLSEQDPDTWIAGVRLALARLRDEAGPAYATVRAIGLSGHMHSVALLDAGLRPVRPALLWNDTRGQAQAQRLLQDVPDISRATGVRPMASFSAAKLLWIRENDPAAFAATRHVLWAKDYVRLWLTGALATDMSDAAGSQLFDQQNRTWFAPVRDYLGLGPAILPELRDGTDCAGRLRTATARDLGLPPGIAVATGGGDTPVGAVGLGRVDAGQSYISLGTGAVYVTVQDTYAPDEAVRLHTFAHCVPRRWYQMAAMLNGASCLAWVAALCRESDLPALLRRVEARGPGPSRILFQPYLRGERTPHDDALARGAFIGLDASCDAVDLARAVLEGVAFSLRQGQDLLACQQAISGPVPLIGGGARSPEWARIMATVLGRDLVIPRNAEHACALGAARLGMVADGWTMADAMPAFEIAQAIAPDHEAIPLYDAQYAQFERLYPAIRSIGQGTAAGL
ncbi:xylulokinase [Gluconacetobacter diazotrophicus PA1 5]|uniref:Xylulose kinase n=1 Tax=Gluconacetobacter diazotrophicus TaxID=33996 RepID=A0A7W4I760_GLUDI|nr:xylulokinase [Gluconacetobacter diazotrophicus]ACI50643.1 xylulokinase [Gluconacetobacter diazotrophicus PA1 5]MBB2157489.1 xylulokinase [Gluconacetobacter diazotrophicus]TWB09475.1 xylulokinase [Gluconacetobacter diazotrophicus]